MEGEIKMGEFVMSNEATEKCFISNGEPYPLCKGNGENCHDCCLYENYEEHHSADED